MPRRLAVLAVLLASLVPFAAARAESGAFVVRTAADTFAIERFTRTADRLEGDLTFRIAGAKFSYVLEFAADGAPRTMHIVVRRLGEAADAAPLQTADMRFEGDSVFVEKTPGGAERVASSHGALPFMNPSFAMFQEIVRRSLQGGGAPRAVPMFLVQGGVTQDAVFTRTVGDTVRIELGGTAIDFAVDADGSIRGGRIPSQGLILDRASAVLAGLGAEPPPDYSAPEGAPYTAEEVRIDGPGGVSLAGTLTRPRDAKAPVPAVVTITGSGLEERDESIPLVRGYRPFRQIADTLARRGIAVLRLDDRGVGGSRGDATKATSEDFAADVRLALAWLRARPGIDGASLALLGHSEGGLIAPLVAAGDPALKAIVLLAGPAWTGRRVIEYQNRQSAERAYPGRRARIDSTVRASMAAVDSLGREQPWLGFFLAHDPLPTARLVKTPVLILQGETDRQVSAEQAPLLAKAFRAGGNRDVTVRVLPRTNHLFLPDPVGDPARYSSLTVKEIPREVLGTIADWLAARLH